MWRKLLRNVLASSGGTLVGLVVGFVTMPLVVHHLGPNEFGLWVLATGVVGYVGVLDLGLAPTLVTESAALLARDDDVARRHLSETASTVLAVYAVLGALAAAGLVAIGLAAGTVFRLPAEDLATFRLVLLIVGVQTALGLPMSVWNGLLSGLQAFHVLNALGAATTLARGAATIALLATGHGVVALAAASSAVAAAGWLTAAIAVHRRIPGLSVRLGGFRRRRLAQLGRFTGAMVVWSVAGTALHQLDRVLIGVVLPVAALARYEVGARLATTSRALLHGWLGVLMPTTSALAAAGGRARGLYLRCTRWLLATYAGVAVLLIGLGAPLVRRWMGPGFGESAAVLAFLVLGSLVQSQNVVAHVMLPALGELRVFTRFMAVYPVVTLGCAVIGIGAGGLVGLACGTAVAIALMETYFLAAIVRRVFGVPVARVVRRCHLPVLRAAAPAAAWIGFVRLTVGVESWAALVVTAAVASGVFAAGVWSAVLTGAERRALRAKLVALGAVRPRRPLSPEVSC